MGLIYNHISFLSYSYDLAHQITDCKNIVYTVGTKNSTYISPTKFLKK